MTGREFIAAMRCGRRLYGSMLASPSPEWPPLVATAGLDWLFIDTEHAARNREMASWMCRTYTAMGIPTVIRILAPDPYLACAAMDAGATGILAPYVESVDQVKAMAGAVKYRPVKGEKLKGILSGKGMEPELARYLAERNADGALLVNIESVAAMGNLDAILSVPELDGIVIGPHDLSCSLGVPEQYDHPAFLAAAEEILTKARAHGKGAGIHCAYRDGIEPDLQFLKFGANLLVHQTDHLAFVNTMRRELGQLRREMGDAEPQKNQETGSFSGH